MLDNYIVMKVVNKPAKAVKPVKVGKPVRQGKLGQVVLVPKPKAKAKKVK